MGIAIYGVVCKLLMFANFPVLGITQGFVPIVGYNYGANLMDRVHGVTKLAVKSATIISFVIFILILVFAEHLAKIFTEDVELIAATADATRKMFLASPLLALSMIGSSYFQAIGVAYKALLLGIAKQGLLLIPLLLALPVFFDLNGIWFAFPIADIGSAILSIWLLKKANVKLY